MNSTKNTISILALSVRKISVLLLFGVLVACGDGGDGNFGGVAPNGNTNVNNNTVVEFDEDSYFITVGNNEISKTNAKSRITSTLFEAGLGVDYVSPGDIVDDIWVSMTEGNYFVLHDVNTGEFLGEIYLGRNSVLDTPSAPVCAGNICYVLSGIYELLAYEIDSEEPSARLLWEKVIFDKGFDNGEPNMAQIVVAKDQVYVAGDMTAPNTTSIWAINRYTGITERSVKILSPLNGTPLLAADKLIVPLADALTALDLSTFNQLWTTGFQGESGFYRTGTPSLAGSVLAFSSYTLKNQTDDYFDRLNYVGVNVNTGAILWAVDAGDARGYTFAPQSNGSSFFGVSSEYRILSGFRSRTGTPMAIDALSGRVLWNKNARAKHTPLVVGNHVYFSYLSVQDGLVGLSAATGEVNYTTTGNVASFASTPMLVSGGKVHRYSWAPAYQP